jgi:hypothetical protein
MCNQTPLLASAFERLCLGLHHIMPMPLPPHSAQKLAAEIREFRSPTDGETRMFYEIVIAPGYTEKVTHGLLF